MKFEKEEGYMGSLGHAICIVGLRRTGKSILLNHLHINASEFGVNEEEILHITLSVAMDDRELSRDDFDYNKLADVLLQHYDEYFRFETTAETP